MFRPSICLRTHEDPAALDAAIRGVLVDADVDVMFLAGYMKKLGPLTQRQRQRRRDKSMTGGGATDRRYVMQFCGGLLLLIVAVLAVSAGRFTYWWAHRDAYVRTEIEVENPGRRGSSVSALVVSTGARVRIDTRYLMPADGWPPGVSRHAVWYNPEAAVSPGIRLLDLRVVSVEKHPSSGSAAVGRWLAVAVLTGIAAFLLSRPYMPALKSTEI